MQFSSACAAEWIELAWVATIDALSAAIVALPGTPVNDKRNQRIHGQVRN